MPFLFSFFFFMLYMIFGFLFFFSFFYQSFIYEFYFFSLSGMDVGFSFVVDYVSLGFFSCVSFISGVVFFYSLFYMEGTVDSRRFYWLVFLFVISMMILVFSGNFIVVMIGWDGLGLVSFCLVIFYSNSSSLESGLVTVFSNRIGDMFFLLCFMFFFVDGWLSWDVYSIYFFWLAGLFLFFGAITKSAQVPFSAWLPAAMAAPTPVSSLVHSSTLVTAGVYVLIRFNYIFMMSTFVLMKMFFLFTMILAGVCAVLESDFKKIVAMSTLSQLGMMMFILSVGVWILSFLHMIIHAFFKSMLFLSTGSLMGQMTGTQDSRFYGSTLMNYGSFLFFIVSSLCLSGFPFFLGFYSKDFIISSSSFGEGFLFYMFFLVGCIFTVMYSTRLIYKCYCVMFKFTPTNFSNESLFFFLPVSVLFLKCWVLGGFMYWFFLSYMKMFFMWADLFIGVNLFIFGIMLYFVIKFVYVFVYMFGMILFLRWKASGGTSFFFKNMNFYKYEGSWMESLGGLGIHSFLLSSSKFMNVYFYVSLGSMIVIFFFYSFYLF